MTVGGQMLQYYLVLGRTIGSVRGNCGYISAHVPGNAGQLEAAVLPNLLRRGRTQLPFLPPPPIMYQRQNPLGRSGPHHRSGSGADAARAQLCLVESSDHKWPAAVEDDELRRAAGTGHFHRGKWIRDHSYCYGRRSNDAVSYFGLEDFGEEQEGGRRSATGASTASHVPDAVAAVENCGQR